MKKKAVYFLLVILLVHSIFVIISMGKPFHGDESIWSESADAILKTGGPIFDYGVNNQNYLAIHIPTNSYIISAFIYLFGYTEYSVRAVSAIFNLFVIVLIYFIILEILKDNPKKEKWALLAVFLYALNPFTIQNSALLDVDSGLLNFSMYLFLYLFIKNKKFYYLVPSLILIFMAKEVGPLFIFSLLIAFNLITLNFKKVSSTIILFIISGVIFFSLYIAFSNLVGINFLETYKMNYLRQGGNFFSKEEIFVHLWNFKNFFYFSIPSFLLIFFICTFVFYRRLSKKPILLKEKKIQNILLFSLFSIGIIIFYLLLGGSGWGFPKYYIIALPAISIFITLILSNSEIIKNFKDKLVSNKWFFLAIFLFLLAYFLFIIKDPLIPELDSTRNNTNLIEALFLISKSFTLYFIIPFVISIFFFYFLKSKKTILLALILLTLFSYIYLDILHASVSYSTNFKYGDIGVKEVVSYIKENNISVEKITTYMHIGHYIGLSEYYDITFVYDYPEKFRKEIVENPNIQYLIIWSKDINRIGENMNYFSLERQIGSYYIFKKVL